MPWHWLQAGSHFHHNQRYHWCFPQHMQGHTCAGWDRIFFEKSTKLPSIWANYHAGWLFFTNPFEKYATVKLDHETPGFGVKINKHLSSHHLAWFLHPPKKLTAGDNKNGGGWKILFLSKKTCDFQTSTCQFSGVKNPDFAGTLWEASLILTNPPFFWGWQPPSVGVLCIIKT